MRARTITGRSDEKRRIIYSIQRAKKTQLFPGHSDSLSRICSVWWHTPDHHFTTLISISGQVLCQRSHSCVITHIDSLVTDDSEPKQLFADNMPLCLGTETHSLHELSAGKKMKCIICIWSCGLTCHFFPFYLFTS